MKTSKSNMTSVGGSYQDDGGFLDPTTPGMQGTPMGTLLTTSCINSKHVMFPTASRCLPLATVSAPRGTSQTERSRRTNVSP